MNDVFNHLDDKIKLGATATSCYILPPILTKLALVWFLGINVIHSWRKRTRVCMALPLNQCLRSWFVTALIFGSTAFLPPSTNLYWRGSPIVWFHHSWENLHSSFQLFLGWLPGLIRKECLPVNVALSSKRVSPFLVFWLIGIPFAFHFTICWLRVKFCQNSQKQAFDNQLLCI